MFFLVVLPERVPDSEIDVQRVRLPPRKDQCQVAQKMNELAKVALLDCLGQELDAVFPLGEPNEHDLFDQIQL